MAIIDDKGLRNVKCKFVTTISENGKMYEVYEVLENKRNYHKGEQVKIEY